MLLPSGIGYDSGSDVMKIGAWPAARAWMGLRRTLAW